MLVVTRLKGEQERELQNYATISHNIMTTDRIALDSLGCLVQNQLNIKCKVITFWLIGVYFCRTPLNRTLEQGSCMSEYKIKI